MIVDPQIDFISGSLKKEKMDALADYILRTDGEYICKLITMDQHPYRHCSFYENGGQWPMHCVVNTIGAAVYQPIMDAVYNTQGEVKMFGPPHRFPALPPGHRSGGCLRYCRRCLRTQHSQGRHRHLRPLSAVQCAGTYSTLSRTASPSTAALRSSMCWKNTAPRSTEARHSGSFWSHKVKLGDYSVIRVADGTGRECNFAEKLSIGYETYYSNHRGGLSGMLDGHCTESASYEQQKDTRGLLLSHRNY